jgi:hypothetical protein
MRCPFKTIITSVRIPTKPWYSPTIPLVGKGIRLLSRLTRHGGSAFPARSSKPWTRDFSPVHSHSFLWGSFWSPVPTAKHHDAYDRLNVG